MRSGAGSSAGGCPRRPGATRRWHRLLALGALLLAAAACATGSGPRKACLRFDAAEDLNLYNGQSHPVTVFVFPLSSSAAFEQKSVEDLLGAPTGSGILAAPVVITIAPGEQDRRLEKLFPAETAQLGVVADYYRSRNAPEGSRRQIVPARCLPFLTPRLTMTTTDLYTN